MSISVDYPMPAPSLSPHATHWGRGLLLALAAHLLIVIWAYWPSHSQPETPLPPAAVMMLLAPQVQAPSLPLPLPQGVQQQMAASASSAKAEPPATEMMPKLAKVEKAEIQVTEQKKSQQSPQPQPRPVVKKKELTQAQSHNAAANSSSAPVAQQQPSHQVSAPLNSNAQTQKQAEANWQSKVLAHLNHFKQYPPDALRRNKGGIVTLDVTLNAQGNVLSSQLRQSAGSSSLDREALAMLQRAQPLPAPPAARLHQGQTEIILPVDFDPQAPGLARR